MPVLTNEACMHVIALPIAVYTVSITVPHGVEMQVSNDQTFRVDDSFPFLRLREARPVFVGVGPMPDIPRRLYGTGQSCPGTGKHKVGMTIRCGTFMCRHRARRTIKF